MPSTVLIRHSHIKINWKTKFIVVKRRYIKLIKSAITPTDPGFPLCTYKGNLDQRMSMHSVEAAHIDGYRMKPRRNQIEYFPLLIWGFQILALAASRSMSNDNCRNYLIYGKITVVANRNARLTSGISFEPCSN